MKKMLFALIISAALSYPLSAQVDQSVSESVPFVTAKIDAKELPPAVTNSVNNRFDKNNPLTWSKIPYKLKDFGWVYEVSDTQEQLSHYEVNVRTSAGGSIYGLYNADGELVETRERSKNVAVPIYIMRALYESPYKEWTVVGNKEVVNLYQAKDNHIAEQHFRLSIEKDNVKKKIAFNYQASTGKLEAHLIR